MPKLPRVTSVLFGSTGPGTDFGQYGSKAAAAPQTQADYGSLAAFIAGCQGLAAWVTGWASAAVGAAFNPYLEDENGAYKVFSYYINQLCERGIPDWDAGTTYYKGAAVQDPAGSGQQFYSLTDNNLNNALPLGASNAQWQWNNAPQVPVGTVLDFSGIVTPTGFLAADGSAVLRATYLNLFAALSVTTSGTTSSGFPQITGIPTTANLQPGFAISGTGIPTNAKILTVDSPTQITMTLNATGSSSPTLVFAPWGVGDGTTTFNLPDTRRRVAVGAGGAGTAVLANVLGQVGGEETHTLTVPEIPSHTHTTTADFSAQTVATGGSNNDVTPGGVTGATGGGGSHNNIQPSYIVTKIIKF